MTGTRIKKYVTTLNEIFKSAPSKHEAHYRSGAVLAEMSGDSEFLTQVLAKHLSSPGTLDSRHYPVVSIDIELNSYYGLVANCWIPLPGRETDIATKPIHHHGTMLLTTVTAYGPGYEHWTFQLPARLDEEHDLFSARLIEHAPHPLSHRAFVDAFVAHLPFFPPSLTITFALWSNRTRTSWKDHLKRLPILRGNEARLRDLAVGLKLAGALDLKLVEYFDFYPTCDGFKGMKTRQEYELGPNENYLFSLFHVIQQTGNEKLAKIVEEKLSKGTEGDNRQVVQGLLEDLHHGRLIEGRLSEGHYGLPHANFTRTQLLSALAQQENFRQAETVPGV